MISFISNIHHFLNLPIHKILTAKTGNDSLEFLGDRGNDRDTACF